ncbi:MAG: MBL fold metallo-hydrolase [Bdellovibrio sp.]|jgi:glyoxylase-like metal-dependent hydrolase (beta-lactamase superfamily II)
MNIKNCLLAFAALPTLISIGCTVAPVKGDRAFNPSKSTPQIYEFESDGNGFNTKNFFYDNGEEVIAFDTQFTPDTAKKSIEFLRTRTRNPITYVVITHPNPDKFNGMSVFQEQGAKVIASRATAGSMKGVQDYKKYHFVNIAKMFTDDSYPKLSQADILFDQNYEIELQNGEIIELSELSSAGVSSNQTVASIASQNALVVGDLIHHKAHAWLEGGIVNGKPTPTLKGWIADLKQISAKFGSKNPTVYGGRGEAVALNVAVEDQIDYLKRADAIVSKYIAALGTRKTELQSVNAGQHYMAIQKLLEKTFPGYQLGYMIQYGVYGLVNSKL